MSLRDIFEAVWNFNILPIIGGIAVLWVIVLVGAALVIRHINKSDTHAPKP